MTQRTRISFVESRKSKIERIKVDYPLFREPYTRKDVSVLIHSFYRKLFDSVRQRSESVNQSVNTDHVANQSTSQSVLTNSFQNSAVNAFVYLCTPSFTHISFNIYIIHILSGILNVVLKHPSSLGVVSTQSMTRFSPSQCLPVSRVIRTESRD